MGIVSDGILRMPPECWGGDAIDVAQRHSVYVSAANELKRLREQKPDLDRLMERLKGLEWEDITSGIYPCSNASSPFGTYDVCTHLRNKVHWRFFHDGFNNLVECDSIEHGKELCWLDYQSRVRALFE